MTVDHHHDHDHVRARRPRQLTADHGQPWRSVNSMAASATLHCLTGCAIGEIAGLMIGTAIGLSNRADDRPGGRPGLPVRLHPVDPAAAQGRPRRRAPPSASSWPPTPCRS